jgi:hypothetical protein
VVGGLFQENQQILIRSLGRRTSDDGAEEQNTVDVEFSIESFLGCPERVAEVLRKIEINEFFHIAPL